MKGFITAIKLEKLDYFVSTLQINNSRFSIIRSFDFQVNFSGD